MANFIVDYIGRKVKIEQGKKYAVLYKYEDAYCIAQNCYQNYPQDDYIGKDDEEGKSNGNPRFYFEPSKNRRIKIIRVLIENNFENLINEILK